MTEIRCGDPGPSLTHYAQVPASPPTNRAKNLATDASKLPFNMSVTSLRVSQNSGSGKPRYGPPDAPLDSCPLVFARVRPFPTKTGIPLPFGSFRIRVGARADGRTVKCPSTAAA